MSQQCCPNCGSTDIETDSQRGDAVCIQCGTVLEENAIVNEVTFAQDAGGGSQVVGQYVAATPGVGSSGLGFKESRELAFNNGQRHISQLAAALRLAEHHQEAAQRLFMLAVQHNFIQGRRTQHVIAACLYTVCRKEKTPHLLIDYSDVLQENVYLLGSCFLKFTRLLSLTLPIIDPSLYIHRFASRLEFGDKTHLVSMSALRLVQRMKRDWIQTGRRPSGICGAALLIAARVHGFRRTQREVVRVVRICDVTLRKRLTEFAETPMGALTARQLESADIEAFPAADPPSYTRNRQAEVAQQLALTVTDEQRQRERQLLELRQLKVAQIRTRLAELGEDVTGKKEHLVHRLLRLEPPEASAAWTAAAAAAGASGDGVPLGDAAAMAAADEEDNEEDEDEEDEQDGISGGGSGGGSDGVLAALMPPPPVDPEEAEMHSEMSRVLQDPALRALGVTNPNRAPPTLDAALAAAAAAAAAPPIPNAAAAPSAATGFGFGEEIAEDTAEASAPAALLPPSAPAPPARRVHVGALQPSWTHSAFFSSDVLASREALAASETEEQQEKLMAELNEDLETLDDEVEGYLITDAEEVQLKKRVWEEMNREYLDQQAEKAAARTEAERLAAERGETLEPGAARPKRPALSKKQRREAQEARAPGTAAEAAAAELRRNKLSSRINYDVVQILSQTLEEDAESMPNAPGPLGQGLAGGAGAAAAEGGATAAAAVTAGAASMTAYPARDAYPPPSPARSAVSDRFSETLDAADAECEPTY